MVGGWRIESGVEVGDGIWGAGNSDIPWLSPLFAGAARVEHPVELWEMRGIVGYTGLNCIMGKEISSQKVTGLTYIT